MLPFTVRVGGGTSHCFRIDGMVCEFARWSQKLGRRLKP